MQIHYRRTGRGVLLSALILAHLSLSAGEGTAVPPPEGTLLLQDFRTLSPDAPLPDGWKTSGKVRIRKTGSAAALALPGGARADRDLKLPEGMKKLQFSCRYKAENIVTGKEGWQDGRIALAFLDDSGKLCGKWPEVPHAKGNTQWVFFSRVYDIPDGATRFRVTPVNFGTAGEFLCSELQVTPLEGRDLLCFENFLGYDNGQAPGDRKSGTVRREGIRASLLLSGPGYFPRDIPIPRGTTHLEFSCDYRTNGLVPGKEGWQDGRVALDFLTAEKKHCGPWPEIPHGKGTSAWKHFSRIYRVPEGAVFFRIMPAHFGVSGSFECTNLRLVRAGKTDVPKPAAFVPDPELKRAWRESSLTQERICLNSLWQFYPVHEKQEEERIPDPGTGWGWFKIPGIWPREDTWDFLSPEQEILVSKLQEQDLIKLTAAWYKRTIRIPAAWKGRKIRLDFRLLQSYAKVFVDGKETGDLLFPGGRLDLTDHLIPGKLQELTILVKARPLKKRVVFSAADRAMEESGTIQRKGITGDLFLEAVPADGPKLRDIRVYSHVGKGEITFDFAAEALPPDTILQATLQEAGLSTGPFPDTPAISLPPVPFSSAVRTDGRFRIRQSCSLKTWDLDTPQNQYTVKLLLKDRSGRVLEETLPVRFGYREFTVSGRDFLLNGKKIHLRGNSLHHPSGFAAQSRYSTCRKTLERLKKFGYNFFQTTNYGFAPGYVGYLEALYRAADDVGMICSFPLPHLSTIDWQIGDSRLFGQYLALTTRLMELVGNNPSIVLYAMNHNATGYEGDQNPLAIDGKQMPKVWNDATRRKALEVAGRIKQMDPSRVIYNHSSGDLGECYTLNIYLNWSPIQERSDWLEHWNKEGRKPVIFVEWGMPHVSSFSNYRGPQFIWTTRDLFQIWDAEYAAAYFGNSAYKMEKENRASLLDQQRRHRIGKAHQWSELVRSSGLEFLKRGYLDLLSEFVHDNWRSHRANGCSAMILWDHDSQWFPRPAKAVAVPDRYRNLERPGIVPDRIQPAVLQLYGKLDDGYLYSSFDHPGTPTRIGEAILRWNQPFCAFLGGKSGDFSEKSHIRYPGDLLEKSCVLLNDTRRDGVVKGRLTLSGTDWSQEFSVPVAAGERKDVPIRLRLPDTLKPGRHELRAEFTFESRDLSFGAKPQHFVQNDTLPIHLLPRPEKPDSDLLVFDPAGKTTRELKRLNLPFRPIGKRELADGSFLRNLARPEKTVLVIGREALDDMSVHLPADAALRNGLTILVMEQSAKGLARLGFRINEIGLREVFPVPAAHPLLRGLNADLLKNWRGESTLTAPYFDGYRKRIPLTLWNGFQNQRVWRNRNRGVIASVLIEKPERGNFLPVLAGGFDLQYTPLLQWRSGNGSILFCQMDLSGRTENDPAADRLFLNLLSPVASRASSPGKVFYSGNPEGAGLLRELGHSASPWTGKVENGKPAILVLGSGFDPAIRPDELRKQGIDMVTFGLSAEESNRALGKADAFAARTVLPDPALPDTGRGLLSGVTRADLYWRGEIPIAAYTGRGNGNEALLLLPRSGGTGALAMLQATPKMFENSDSRYFRKTIRRNRYLAGRLLYNLGARTEDGLLRTLSRPGVLRIHPLFPGWKGIGDAEKTGKGKGFFLPSCSLATWRPVEVPGMFNLQFDDVPEIGYFWYALDFEMPSHFAPGPVTLELGGVDDESWVWLNGKFLGEVSEKTHPKTYWHLQRRYTLSPSLLKNSGRNRLTILVNNLRGSGGLTGLPRLSAGPVLYGTDYYIQDLKQEDDPYRYYHW